MSKKQVSLVRWLLGAAFFIYLWLLFDLVFLSAYYGRANAEVLRYQTYNLIPFKTIKNYISVMNGKSGGQFVTNVIGNIVAFMPLGFLAPILFKSLRRMGVMVFIAFALSLFIELTQGYLGVGVMDVDDLILNGFGGFLGYIAFYIMTQILKYYKRRSTK